MTYGTALKVFTYRFKELYLTIYSYTELPKKMQLTHSPNCQARVRRIRNAVGEGTIVCAITSIDGFAGE